MNITQRHQGGVTVKQAINQLKKHRDGLTAHGESTGDADFYIDKLENSKQDFLLDAFEHSKGVAEKWRVPIELCDDGGIFGVAAFPSIVALSVGLMTGPVGFGLALAGSAAYVTGVFKAGDKLHDHTRFAQGSDFISEAVNNPKDRATSSLKEYTRQDLIDAYDKRISTADLSAQTYLREERAALAALPEANVADLLVEHPKSKQVINKGLSAFLNPRERNDNRKSQADLSMDDTLNILQQRREAQLQNLDEKAAAETQSWITTLGAAKGETLLEAHEDLKKTSKALENVTGAGAIASVGSLLAGGVALAMGAMVIGVPAIAAAGVLGTASYLLGKKNQPMRTLAYHDGHKVEAALNQEMKEPKNPVAEISRSKLFGFIEEQISQGTLEDQSFYREARNKLEKRAGDNGAEMFSNAVKSENEDHISVLKSVLQSMQNRDIER